MTDDAKAVGEPHVARARRLLADGQAITVRTLFGAYGIDLRPFGCELEWGWWAVGDDPAAIWCCPPEELRDVPDDQPIEAASVLDVLKWLSNPDRIAAVVETSELACRVLRTSQPASIIGCQEPRDDDAPKWISNSDQIAARTDKDGSQPADSADAVASVIKGIDLLNYRDVCDELDGLLKPLSEYNPSALFTPAHSACLAQWVPRIPSSCDSTERAMVADELLWLIAIRLKLGKRRQARESLSLIWEHLWTHPDVMPSQRARDFVVDTATLLHSRSGRPLGRRGRRLLFSLLLRFYRPSGLRGRPLKPLAQFTEHLG
jgi:hypothetical protein